MRVHHLQHVPFEGLGCIEEHLLRHGHQLSATHLYRSEPLPGFDDYDALIVMGGPMGVSDQREYPWLQPEIDFIGQSIQQGKNVLGICLGAQLIAAALGANVYRNRWREIGWWPVTRADSRSKLLPEQSLPFHWHGDTFDLPHGATLLASSEACRNQAFTFGDRVIGLQFHLETTPLSARELITHGCDELDRSRYVQSAEEILSDTEHFTASNRLMAGLLDRWLNQPTSIHFTR